MEVRRKAGRLRVLATSAGRGYLILDQPGNERYLRPGTVLEPDELCELETVAAREAGLVLAYNLISRRDRSVFEIRKALTDENIENQEVIDYIVGALQRQGYLDDRRLASDFVDYRKRHDPAGPGLIRKKLRDAGIDEEIIEAEIAGSFSRSEEREAAEALAGKRLETMRSLGRETVVRRINGYLARRGFSRSVIDDICASILRKDFFGE
ncbi:MAG: RecX family transcriptional regulator [Candidatus Krumholzibacteriota bacterium]|nr:RecX family transcriptional regulator [Candidatus Krumholzibacteriota bacterium]